MLSGDEYIRDGQALRTFCEKRRKWDDWVKKGACVLEIIFFGGDYQNSFFFFSNRSIFFILFLFFFNQK